jgi:hypothetical protein
VEARGYETIPGFEYFIQNSTKPGNTKFRKLDLFPSSGEGKEVPTLLGPLEKAGPMIGVSSF